LIFIGVSSYDPYLTPFSSAKTFESFGDCRAGQFSQGLVLAALAHHTDVVGRSYDEASTEPLVLFHTADESSAHAVLVRACEVLSGWPEYNASIAFNSAGDARDASHVAVYIHYAKEPNSASIMTGDVEPLASADVVGRS
jgi:hypothetical protein